MFTAHQEAFPAAPRVSVAPFQQQTGSLQMVQTTRRSALLPANNMHSSHLQQQTTPADRAALPRAQSPVVVSANTKPPSSPPRDSRYPHAPPPARHRSRSPDIISPNSQADHELPQPVRLSSTHSRPAGVRNGHVSPRRPFHSAQGYPMPQERHPLMLRPTPVRAPCSFSFELAPSKTEFLYIGPQTSQPQSAAASEEQQHQPLFKAVLCPIRNTECHIPPSDLGIIYSDPEAFDESIRIPEELRDDPRVRRLLDEGFLYATMVTYDHTQHAATGEEMKGRDQEAVEQHEALRDTQSVVEDQLDASQQLDVPGMWRE